MRRNSVNLLLTLKEAALLILINGFPRINSASFALSSSSCCCCSCHIGRKCTKKVREEIEEMGGNDYLICDSHATCICKSCSTKIGVANSSLIFLVSMFIFQEILILKKLFSRKILYIVKKLFTDVTLRIC